MQKVWAGAWTAAAKTTHGITVEALRDVAGVTEDWLLEVMNSLLEEQSFPTE